MADDKTETTPEDAGRRKEDRRQTQEPLDGPDRRKSERRTGDDRRRNPRS